MPAPHSAPAAARRTRSAATRASSAARCSTASTCISKFPRCPRDKTSRYQSKLSGPLLDRIDLHVEVPALPAEQLLQASAGETSAAIRERVARARALALARQGKSNQALQGQEIDTQ